MKKYTLKVVFFIVFVAILSLNIQIIIRNNTDDITLEGIPQMKEAFGYIPWTWPIFHNYVIACGSGSFQDWNMGCCLGIGGCQFHLNAFVNNYF